MNDDEEMLVAARDTVALVLAGVGVGVLAVRALRSGRGIAAVRDDLARVGSAFERLDGAFNSLARKAVGCRAPQQCTCAICAEEQDT